jgi:hypothetical protein
MKFENIEVSGITDVTINRKAHYHKDGPLWVKNEGRAVSHNKMMEIINHIKGDNRYRFWIHLNFLNIVRK